MKIKDCGLTNKEREKGVFCRSMYCESCKAWKRAILKTSNNVEPETKYNFLISVLHKSNDKFEQIREEESLKNSIASLLNSSNHKFLIADSNSLKQNGDYEKLLFLAKEMFQQLELMDYESKAKETYDEFKRELSEFE